MDSGPWEKEDGVAFDEQSGQGTGREESRMT